MINLFNINKNTVFKLINKIIEKMSFQFLFDKLVGENKTVQIDETMLNYKFRGHGGIPSENRTDALVLSSLMRK